LSNTLIHKFEAEIFSTGHPVYKTHKTNKSSNIKNIVNQPTSLLTLIEVSFSAGGVGAL